jgi:hypothetical protein
MCTLDDIVTEVGQDCAEEYRLRVRARLLQQPREWLVDQLLAHVADLAAELNGAADPAARNSDDASPAEREAERSARVTRIRAMRLDERRVRAFVDEVRRFDRERLEMDEYIVRPIEQGRDLMGPRCRSPRGEALLRRAKDVLHALLFGDQDDEVRLKRVHRELLTIAIPCAKAEAISAVLEAATEIRAQGTWHDPEHVSDDARAANTLIQVEYGETASEVVGHGIAAALRVINDLEINEQVLYARMENVEESTLA